MRNRNRVAPAGKSLLRFQVRRKAYESAAAHVGGATSAIHREQERREAPIEWPRVSAIMFTQLDILLGAGAWFYCSFIVCRRENSFIRDRGRF